MFHVLPLMTHVICLFAAAGDDLVHVPVQERSQGGLHQSAKVLKLNCNKNEAERKTEKGWDKGAAPR